MKKVRLDPHSGQEHAPAPPKSKVKSPVRAKERVPVQEFRQVDGNLAAAMIWIDTQ